MLPFVDLLSYPFLITYVVQFRLIQLIIGGAALFCALGAAICDEPWGSLPSRGGSHGATGDARAGLVQSLPSHVAE
jgi:hypothetical protein